MWPLWWQFNRDQFIVRARYRKPTATPQSNDTGVFLGGRTQGKAPTPGGIDWNRLQEKMFPVLHAALRDSNPSVRADAAIALGKIARVEDVPVLIGALADTTTRVREAAALAIGLSEHTEGIAPLLDVLRANARGNKLRGGRDPEHSLQAVAALGLGLIGRDPKGEVSTALIRASGHRNAPIEVAMMSTIALGLIRDGGPVETHLKRLASSRKPRAWVRAQAVTSLARQLGARGTSPDAQTLTGFTRLMRNGRSVDVRRSATSAFALLLGDTGQGHPDRVLDAASKLLARMHDKAADTHVRNLAAISIGFLGRDAGIRALCSSVRTAKREASRTYAALGLGISIRRAREQQADTPAIAHGLEALRRAFMKERNRSTRAALALALGLARDNEAGEPILAALRKNNDQLFRGYAAIALGMIGHKPAAADLTAMLTQVDYQPLVRERIALGLAIMGAGDLGPLFDQLRARRSSYALQALAKAVGLVGDEKAVAPLLTLASDRRSTALTRAAACSALGTLGDPHPIPVLASLRAHYNYLASTGSINRTLTADD